MEKSLKTMGTGGKAIGSGISSAATTTKKKAGEVKKQFVKALKDKRKQIYTTGAEALDVGDKARQEKMANAPA